MSPGLRPKIARAADLALEPFLIGLILVLPFEKHSAPILSFGLYGALVFVVVKILLGRYGERRPTPLDLPILLLLLAAVLSAVTSIEPLVSLKSMRRSLLSYLMVYYVMIYGVGRIGRAKRLLWAFLMGSVPVCLWGIGSFVLRRGLVDGRIHASFYHPNRLANYLILVIALSYALAEWYRAVRRARYLLLLVLGLSLCAFVLTASRGASFGLIIGLFAALGLREKRVWILLAAIVIVSVAVLPFQRKELHLFRTFDLLTNKDTKRLWGERPLLWESGLRVIKDHPIFGIGYGKTFNLVYLSHYAPPSATQDHSSTHNVLIEFATEMGPLGLLAFLWLHLIVLKEAWLICRKKTTSDRFASLVAAGILAGLVGVLVNGMFNYFYRDRLILIFWFLVGLLMRLRVMSQRRDSGEGIRLSESRT